MAEDLIRQLTQIARSLEVSFSFNGKQLLLEEVFSTTGLLPGIAKRADQLSSLCLGYGLGLAFEDSEKALLGLTVRFDENTPTVLRLLCMTDTLMELIRAARGSPVVPLDELMYD